MSTSSQEEPAYHHGDLRATLVAATLDMLEEGTAPAALSLREAARRAGVSAMAPYRHFADKEELLAAAAKVGFERLEAALRDADEAADRRAGLDAQGVAYVAFGCANPGLFRLMFGAVLGRKHGDLAIASKAAFMVMSDRVTGLVGTDPEGFAALKCWAVVHGLTSLAIDGQLDAFGRSPVDLARSVLGCADPNRLGQHGQRLAR